MAQATKQSKMQELRRRATLEIGAGPGEQKVVWGQGSLDANIVFVGESPGRQEEAVDAPFIGPAGQLLRHELESLGVRPEDVYFTNVVKSRVTTPTPAGGFRNRAPTTQEVEKWLPFLREEIAIIQPRVIVCLGAIAGRALVSETFQMSEHRGKWSRGPAGQRLVATYHPSYVMRFGARQSTKRKEFRGDLADAIRQAAMEQPSKQDEALQ